MLKPGPGLRVLITVLALGVAYVVLAACGGGGGGGNSGQQALSVSIDPQAVSLRPGGTQQFHANASNGTAATFALQEPGGGTVGPSGFYTAPSGTGTYHVIATSVVDPTKTATATITVSTVQEGGSARITPVGEPLATKSYSTSITPPGGVPIVVTKDKVRGLPLDPATFPSLPVGTLTSVTTAYSETGGTGIAVATATAPITITSGSTTNIQVSLVSTIDHLEATIDKPSIPVGATAQVSVVAKNASGSPVPLTSDSLRWSSDSSAASVDLNGKVSGSSPGTAHIMVTDTESGKSTSTTVTVTAILSNDPPGEVVFDDRVDFPGNGTDTLGYGRFRSTNTQWTIDGIGKLRFYDSAGNLTKTTDLQMQVNMAVQTPDEHIWVATSNTLFINILDKDGNIVQYANAGVVLTVSVDVKGQKVICSGFSGVRAYSYDVDYANAQNFKHPTVLTTQVAIGGASNGVDAYYQNADGNIYRVPLTGGTPVMISSQPLPSVMAMYAAPNGSRDLVVALLGSNNELIRFNRNGNTAGYGALTVPASVKVLDIIVDASDSSGLSLFFPSGKGVNKGHVVLK
jgi:hypothetical protein